MQKSERIILDTPVFMTFLITKKMEKFDNLLENKTAKILFSQELLNEFVDMMHRVKFKLHFGQPEIQKTLAQLKLFGSFVMTKSVVTVCTDHKENFLLALAKDGRADTLITVDRNLLLLETFENTKIISMNDYLISLNSEAILNA